MMQVPTPSFSSNFLIEEYKALKSEILKRIELQHQFFSFILVALGTLLTVGFTSQQFSIILLFPILMLFAATVSYSNVIIIQDMGYYIKMRIEPMLPTDDLGWERFYHSDIISRSNTFYYLSFIWVNFVFFTGIGVIIVVVGLFFITTFNLLEHILLCFAIICWLLTLLQSVAFARKSYQQGLQSKLQSISRAPDTESDTSQS